MLTLTCSTDSLSNIIEICILVPATSWPNFAEAVLRPARYKVQMEVKYSLLSGLSR